MHFNCKRATKTGGSVSVKLTEINEDEWKMLLSKDKNNLIQKKWTRFDMRVIKRQNIRFQLNYPFRNHTLFFCNDQVEYSHIRLHLQDFLFKIITATRELRNPSCTNDCKYSKQLNYDPFPKDQLFHTMKYVICVIPFLPQRENRKFSTVPTQTCGAEPLIRDYLINSAVNVSVQLQHISSQVADSANK